MILRVYLLIGFMIGMMASSMGVASGFGNTDFPLYSKEVEDAINKTSTPENKTLRIYILAVFVLIVVMFMYPVILFTNYFDN